jgi:hypothetical protein
MGVSKVEPLDDQNKFCLMIGHVCLQWALLELGLLSILAALQNLPPDEAETIFGGLDMQPRCNMAINLARMHRLPRPMIQRLEAIRKALQGGLADRRNQAVHGAHAESHLPGHIQLRMVRWKGEKSVQHVSIADMYSLTKELGVLAQEAGSIFDDYGLWKFGDHGRVNARDDFPKVRSGVWLNAAQNIKTRLNHLRGWFKV